MNSGGSAGPARLSRTAIGDLKVTFLPDGVSLSRPLGLFPGTTDVDWAAQRAALDRSGYLPTTSGALLIEHRDRAMLIDSGFGPARLAPEGHPVLVSMVGGSLIAHLRAAGRQPEDIEMVAFSHLHPDHVGWAVQLAEGSDVPVFTRADYLVADVEWAARATGLGVSGPALDLLAARMRGVTDGEMIFPGVRVLALPGHTVGHVGFWIESRGQQLLAFGDALHSTVQFAHPEWPLAGEWDQDHAAQSRRVVLDMLIATSALGYGGHFADRTFGHLLDTADGPLWRPSTQEDG